MKNLKDLVIEKLWNNNDESDFEYRGWYKNEYIGSLYVYMHNSNTAYIQYASFTDEKKGIMAPGLFKKVTEKLLKEYLGLMIRIENKNIKAIKVALNAGFLITGIRYDGAVFVELMRTR